MATKGAVTLCNLCRNLSRIEFILSSQLVKELVVEDSTSYRDFFRPNSQQFEFILKKIAKLITKNETLMWPSIKPAERLAVTLRYLVTGETFKSLEYSFRIIRTLISSIVTECCEAIYRTLRSEYLKALTMFEERWNFPNGIGAIDGKRIILQQPYNAGSYYFDYKSNNQRRNEGLPRMHCAH